MSEMLSDDPGEFARQLMDAGLMGPPASTPWRAEVMKWPPPWRRKWGELTAVRQDAGMGWRQAEEEAYREMLELRANPRPLRGKMADGTRVVKDAVERPKPIASKVTRSVRKKYRDQGGGLFDGMDDGASTTYGKDV